MFTVTLISASNHTFEYKSNAKTEEQAIKSAFNSIKSLGWEHYKYKLLKCIKIKSKRITI